METSIIGHSHVDPAIGWHGEPHVSRVGVDGILRIAEREEVFLIALVTSILCEDLDALVLAISTAGVQDYIYQHILCCWGYDTGNDIGKSPWVLHVGASNVSQWQWSLGVWNCLCHITGAWSINCLLQIIYSFFWANLQVPLQEGVEWWHILKHRRMRGLYFGGAVRLIKHNGHTRSHVIYNFPS